MMVTKSVDGMLTLVVGLVSALWPAAAVASGGLVGVEARVSSSSKALAAMVETWPDVDLLRSGSDVKFLCALQKFLVTQVWCRSGVVVFGVEGLVAYALHMHHADCRAAFSSR
ncbi:uncharacterized protein IWZ02DRAFT_452673 [Phyllosticta citriasiana]|uniref:uncharacterized protein n=1 Tax=Phyllosticta citriasiana TaxID=595635 RepID=UPI0030FDF653